VIKNRNPDPRLLASEVFGILERQLGRRRRAIPWPDDAVVMLAQPIRHQRRAVAAIPSRYAGTSGSSCAPSTACAASTACSAGAACASRPSQPARASRSALWFHGAPVLI